MSDSTSFNPIHAELSEWLEDTKSRLLRDEIKKAIHLTEASWEDVSNIQSKLGDMRNPSAYGTKFEEGLQLAAEIIAENNRQISWLREKLAQMKERREQRAADSIDGELKDFADELADDSIDGELKDFADELADDSIAGVLKYGYIRNSQRIIITSGLAI